MEWFEGIMEVGYPVYYYPMAVKDEQTVPLVAFVAQGWGKGVCDLNVLPNQDGTVERRDHVFHIGDPRMYGEHDTLTRGAVLRGFWEPVPWMPLKFAKPKPAKD